MYFQWTQLIHAIPQIWNNKTEQNLMKNESNLLVLNHHFIKNARILTLDKFAEKEIYSILISSLKNKMTSQNYFENLFPKYTFKWKQIYFIPRIINYQLNFQYKILHNMLYLNKKPYIFGKIDSPLRSICHSNDETNAHLFCECVRVNQLWSQFRIFLSTDLKVPLLRHRVPSSVS